MLAGCIGDLKHAARSLARRPWVSLAAIVSLALGIGVNTSIFSVFERLLIRTLPVGAPAELVLITSPGPRPGNRSTGDSGGVEQVFSYPLFRDLEALPNTGLSRIAAHRDFAANLAYDGHTDRGHGLLVSGGYFPVLQVQPTFGRLLTVDDDRLGADPVIVVSYAFWESRLGADPRVIGSRVTVNGEPMVIVGVAPVGFRGTTALDAPDVFVPLALTERVHAFGVERNNHWLYLFARLQPGTTRDAAELAINQPFGAILREIEYPLQQRGLTDTARRQFLARRIVLEDGKHYRAINRDEVRLALLLLLTVTAIVLLIACANVANLLLAQAADRAGEFAVRLSLGASTARVVRLTLFESVLLGLVAATLSLLVARVAMAAMYQLLPVEDATLIMPFELNRTILLFTFAIGIGTSLLFGIVPSLHSAGSAAIGTHAASAGRATTSRRAARFRTSLATVQIALATVLLAQAGLFTTSLANVSREALGIRSQGLVTFRVSPYLNGYTRERALALFDSLAARLRALPGVVDVSASTNPLLSDSSWRQNITVEGFTAAAGDDAVVSTARVGEHYLRTLGIVLLAGREFSASDVEGVPKVAIVNEAFARKFDLGGRVLGRRLALGVGETAVPDIEIVGLTRDAKYSKVREAAPPQLLLPYRQGPAPALTFYVRTESSERGVLASVSGLVAGLDAALPVEHLRTMDDQIWDNVTPDRVFATLSASVAGLALVLAAVGLYGVLGYTVSQRVKEIGIRLALGARGADIRRMLFRQVAVMAVIGTTVGIAVAVALGRAGASMLFGLSGETLPLITGAAGAVALVALLAATLPARRASRIDPAMALRAE